MKIKELQPGQGSVNIEASVKSLDEVKIINKYGRELKLRNVVITDGEDEIKLTLWNDDVDKVKQGSVVKITNGYVNEFQGEKQLTTGKFGKLEVLGEEGSKEQKSESDSGEDSEEDSEEKSEEIPEECIDY